MPISPTNANAPAGVCLDSPAPSWLDWPWLAWERDTPRRLVGPGDSVLEVAAGAGWLTAALVLDLA